MCAAWDQDSGNGCGSYRGSPRRLGDVHRPREPPEPVPQLPQPKNCGGNLPAAPRKRMNAWARLRGCPCAKAPAGIFASLPPGQKSFEMKDAKPRGLLRAGFFPHGLRAAGKKSRIMGKQEESSTISRRRISRPPGRSANRGCAPPYPSPCQTQGSGDAPAVCALQQISELPYRRTTFIVRFFLPYPHMIDLLQCRCRLLPGGLSFHARHGIANRSVLLQDARQRAAERR